MTLEQLRIFIGVAELQHMTRGAESVHVTQSAASAAIAALEARHGVALFHRVGRGIELTEAGRMFLGEARAVVGRAASAELALAEYAGLKRGTLRAVASQTIASYWLPPFLAVFRERHPLIALEIAVDNTEGAAARIIDGSAEIGFVEGRIDEPALAQWQVARDRMVLVSREAVDTVDDAWIRSARWVIRERGSGTRSSFEAVLIARGIDPADLDVVMTLPSNEAVRTAVESGAGVAVLSELVVSAAVGAGRLSVLPLALPDRPFHALLHKERYRTRAAEALASLMKESG